MSKSKKGGLGRGLNSLLGSEADVNASREVAKQQPASSQQPHQPAQPAPAPQPERVVVEATELKRKEERVQAQKPSEPVKTAEATAHPAEKATNEIYSSKEDNITIKGVVERAVERVEKKEEQPAVKEEPVHEEKDDADRDEVPIEQVNPNPHQPRTNFNKEELEELAESIKRNGLLQPILVREKDGKYEIIAGERRWQACKLLGLKKVPIRVRNVDDDETIALALIENIQRSDLNPIEEAYGYRRMMERGNMTQSQVAQAVSKGRSTIANALRLLELPEEAQQLLFEEKISAGHARAILSIPTKEGRAKLTEKLVTDKLSVRETESIARLMSGKKNATPAESRPKAPKSFKTVARSLRETLKTDVRVKSVKGKNKIEILFKDEADLERLFRIIASE